MIVGLMDVSAMFDDEALYQRCMSVVSDERRTKVAKYKNHKDSCRSVGAAVLLNVILREYVEGELTQHAAEGGVCKSVMQKEASCDRGEIICNGLHVIKLLEAVDMVKDKYNWNIKYSGKGKPEFDWDKIKESYNDGRGVYADSIHFNMSHAGNYVACVVADSCVGIDIEGKRRISESVARRYFSQSERESIKSDDDFFKLWTFKEALGKYSGQGIMSSIEISENDVEDRVNVRRCEYDGYQICVVSGQHRSIDE